MDDVQEVYHNLDEPEEEGEESNYTNDAIF